MWPLATELLNLSKILFKVRVKMLQKVLKTEQKQFFMSSQSPCPEKQEGQDPASSYLVSISQSKATQ